MTLNTKAPREFEYIKEGVMIGLEFHQQVFAPYGVDHLNKKYGGKLFCPCPAILRDDEADFTIVRRLRAVSGETGDIDISAQFEKMKHGHTIYEGFDDTTCLVEIDEEPIAPINPEALFRALAMARQLFRLELVDEIMVSRKAIIDGSNTSGFQRTALIAYEGKDSYIMVDGKRIGIYQANLEEDSAKNVGKDGTTKKYRLDRLGIPLIEIATQPDMQTPEEGLATAKHIGGLLRTTGYVKRGQGTIRQDLNVSISRGTRIEIKGVSELEIITEYIKNECIRQSRMLDLLEEMHKREIDKKTLNSIKTQDLTSIFRKCKAKFVKTAITNKQKVMGALLPKMGGLLEYELQPDYRLGTEISEIVKVTAGAGGILHSDELPKFGITQKEVAEVRKKLKLKENDAFVLVIAEKEIGKKSIESIRFALTLWMENEGLIPEVRSPRADGTTGYLRPLPGKARMYPETDSPPIHIDEIRDEIEGIHFEMPDERSNRYQNKFKLSKEFANILAIHPQNTLFEMLVSENKVDANLVANTLLSTVVNLRRDKHDVEQITDDDFQQIFTLITKRKISKDSIEKILVEICGQEKRKTISEIVEKLGLGMISEEKVREIVSQVVDENKSLLDRGMGAIGPIMGKAMAVLSGKADGKLISGIVREEIKKRI